VAEKLTKFVNRRYIEVGEASSLIGYFTIPKGESNVHLVFDDTKSGLNAVIYAPTFALPIVDTLIPKLEAGYWQADVDIGEQNYKYLLDPVI
jgi:hypothetical protein